MTSTGKQRLMLDRAAVPPLARRRVAIVDDVVATGSSLAATFALARAAGANIVGAGVILTEGHDWKKTLGGDAGLVQGLGRIPQFSLSVGCEPQRIHVRKEETVMADLRSFITGMPKCELHVHIEGTLEPEMKFDLAKRNGMTLPYKDVTAMRAAYDFHDLPSFLKIYYEGMRVLVHEPDFYDLTYAYLAKAHAHNVRYVEMFFDPQPHTGRGVAFDVVIRGIRRAQTDAERMLGVKSQLIMCFLRDWSAEFAMTTLVQALPYREWIVGVGLELR